MENAGPKIIGIVIVCSLFAWFLSYLQDINSGSKTNYSYTQERNNDHDEAEKLLAYRMAQRFVKEQLKSPSTAEFPSPWSFDYEKQIEYKSNRTYVVRAHVDSENSFGAKIRKSFVAEVKQTDKDEWILVELNFK